MTREEAIERISDHMEVHKIGEYPHIKLAVALNMALNALRAHQPPAKLDRSRWGWCHACENECCELCIYEYSDMGEPPCSSCINGNMELTNYKPKPFCAKCGRPLTEEAWAELEGRINGWTIDRTEQNRNRFFDDDGALIRGAGGAFRQKKI